jgi:arylsulfatase
MRLRAGTVLLLGALSACGPGDTAEPSTAPAKPLPSIVFLSVDTLAAGHTSLHGYARRTTPALEELAREALVFERCLSNAPYTTPSYASQFTGLLPSCSRVVDPLATGEGQERPAEPRLNWRVPAERWTLAEMLQAAGYRTAAFVDNPMAGPAAGLDQGFELYDTSAAEISANDPEGGFRAILPKALAWIDGLPGGEPFFLFLNVLDVHSPYIPPAELEDHFAEDGLGEPDQELPVGNGFGQAPRSVLASLRLGPETQRVRTAPLVARYDQEIVAVDRASKTLFDGLRQRGLFDGLIVLFSADHGEAMGQAEQKFTHGIQIDEVLHVPLVLKLPGGAHGGRRIAEPVQLLDLYPTLAELLGLEAPANLAGRSLVPLLSGERLAPASFVHEGGSLLSSAISDGEWRLVVTYPGYNLRSLISCARGHAWFEEHNPELLPALAGERGLAETTRGGPETRSVLESALRELRGPFFELYHLPSDPHQRVDRAAAEPEVVARLRAALTAAQARAAEERRRVPVGEELPTEPADLEELRVLGYAGEEEE